MDFYSKNFLQESLKMFRFVKKADYNAVLCQSIYELLITFPASIACRQMNFVRIFSAEPHPRVCKCRDKEDCLAFEIAC